MDNTQEIVIHSGMAIHTYGRTCMCVYIYLYMFYAFYAYSFWFWLMNLDLKKMIHLFSTGTQNSLVTINPRKCKKLVWISKTVSHMSPFPGSLASKQERMREGGGGAEHGPLSPNHMYLHPTFKKFFPISKFIAKVCPPCPTFVCACVTPYSSC